MADRFYGIDRGEQGVANVTEGSSSTATTDVEVRVDLAANMSKMEVLLALGYDQGSDYAGHLASGLIAAGDARGK
jgi:hypothetical protein